MNSNDNENKVVYLRIDEIIPNRFQPREVFDETGLEELADSIREHGVIQPIIVRQLGEKYELIAGERRTKASALAGLTTIPAIVRNMDDRESAKVSLLENLQRKNLSAIEEARTYKRILELDNMTQDDLAKTMGKSQPLIANKLRLLSLPEEVQDALIKNQISERHARSLLNVKDKEKQLMLLERIKTERLTVRELDVEIKKINQPNGDNSTNPGNDRMALNTFNESSIPTNNSNLNFGNMGLNDYRTQVNSNMFNNMPNNYPGFNNPSDNQFANIPNNEPQNINNNFDYGNFSNENNNYLNEPFQQPDMNNINNQVNNPNNFSSLGSMFDGEMGTGMQQNLNENQENQNIFVSHIKEEMVKPQENQFLPNFDDMPMNNPNEMQDGFMHNQDMNSFNQNNNFMNNNFDFNNNFNNNFNNDFNNNMGNHYDEPINDLNGLTSYNDNQGDLFNQPLNLVDVPKTNYYYQDNYNQDIYNPNNFDTATPDFNNPVENNQNDLETTPLQNQSFDNPFDDPYENILFAKPVPIKPEDEPEEVKQVTEEVEVIGETENQNKETKEEKNQYISLDPQQTIFDTRGAVLELKKTTDRIKQNKINIDTEEIDFDDYYQIVIKIKKD
ncbi:MAG: ParB/RepB/Spo0J family partition protein [Bacilli bacterium]|nr:ParB/RepB/Spo0J family partition protein [Bacilli bacterium]